MLEALEEAIDGVVDDYLASDKQKVDNVFITKYLTYVNSIEVESWDKVRYLAISLADLFPDYVDWVELETIYNFSLNIQENSRTLSSAVISAFEALEVSLDSDKASIFQSGVTWADRLDLLPEDEIVVACERKFFRGLLNYYHSENHCRDALSLFEEAKQIDESYLPAYMFAGFAQFDLEEWGEAIGNFEAAIDSKDGELLGYSKFGNAIVCLSYANLKTDRPEKVRETVEAFFDYIRYIGKEKDFPAYWLGINLSLFDDVMESVEDEALKANFEKDIKPLLSIPPDSD